MYNASRFNPYSAEAYYPNTIFIPYKRMEFLYALDYGSSSIYEIIVNEEVDLGEESTEEILKKHGLDIDSCVVMWSAEKLSIKTLTHIVK